MSFVAALAAFRRARGGFFGDAFLESRRGAVAFGRRATHDRPRLDRRRSRRHRPGGSRTCFRERLALWFNRASVAVEVNLPADARRARCGRWRWRAAGQAKCATGTWPSPPARSPSSKRNRQRGGGPAMRKWRRWPPKPASSPTGGSRAAPIAPSGSIPSGRFSGRSDFPSPLLPTSGTRSAFSSGSRAPDVVSSGTCHLPELRRRRPAGVRPQLPSLCAAR